MSSLHMHSTSSAQWVSLMFTKSSEHSAICDPGGEMFVTTLKLVAPKKQLSFISEGRNSLKPFAIWPKTKSGDSWSAKSCKASGMRKNCQPDTFSERQWLLPSYSNAKSHLSNKPKMPNPDTMTVGSFVLHLKLTSNKHGSILCKPRRPCLLRLLPLEELSVFETPEADPHTWRAYTGNWTGLDIILSPRWKIMRSKNPHESQKAHACIVMLITFARRISDVWRTQVTNARK